MIAIEIPQEKYFYVCDGTIIKSLQELPDALRNMNPETFSCHVNEQKNDFYNWVKDVFEHTSLARNIKDVKRKENMAKRVFMELFA